MLHGQLNQACTFSKMASTILKITHLDVVTAFYNPGNNLFANFHLTITTSEVHGTQDSADFYGIIFRSSPYQNRYYFFEIDTCCGTVQYDFLYYNAQSKQNVDYSEDWIVNLFSCGLNPDKCHHNHSNGQYIRISCQWKKHWETNYRS